jgi:hypothetical protein
MEAVLSVRKLAGDGFFRIDTLLKKEEGIRREARPWVSFGACYKERESEAQHAAREIFDAFLQIGTANRALITASPVAWAYGQTDALLREEFGSAQSLQEFHKIKLWIKEYCDGKDHSLMPATRSDKDWKEYLCRESWRAPMWLRIAASRPFTNDTSVWGDLGEQSALQRLDNEETEGLLDGICRLFWSAVHAALESKARLESVNLASHAAVEPAAGGGQVESAEQTKQTSPGAADHVAATAQQSTFSRRGDTWSVTFGGEPYYLSDQLGLQYLARLLERPGQEFPALEFRASIQTPETPALNTAPKGTESVDSSFQERSDLKALREYRNRISEISNEIVRARNNNDLGRIEELGIEEDQIRDFVRSDTGLRGRSRAFPNDRERARKSVSNAIQKAIDAIRDHCPALAEHFRENVKTGNSFSYRETGLQWEVRVR